jgi:hypothetical protein
VEKEFSQAKDRNASEEEQMEILRKYRECEDKVEEKVQKSLLYWSSKATQQRSRRSLI